MLLSIERSEKLYRYAVTDWIADSEGTRARYEFISKIDQERKIAYFVYVTFKYGIFKRLFARGRIEKSRYIASTTGAERDFLYQFNLIRNTIWGAYDHQIPFRFLELEELRQIEFGTGFLRKLKLYFTRAYHAAVDVLEHWKL